MQTTLLGSAIALILALIAALIGPYFVDWNRFRPEFEAQATKIVGAPVKVSGDLAARLLPTPTLRLGSVSIGGSNELGKVRADRLDMELSLGELMRGEWRATELTVGGMSLDLGIDREGRIGWPASSGTFNFASLSIDRLSVAGRIVLHDAASGAMLELADVAFAGDVRSLAGAIHGEGRAKVDGTRYPFRISSAQSNNGSGTRIHLVIDPGERPLSADLDGVLNFAARAARFEGGLTLSVPPPPKGKPAGAPMPWKITTKLRADHAAARLDQIEASFGSDQRALRFSGAGDVRFGASPLLHAVLSARELDADRFMGHDDAPSRQPEPVEVLTALRALMSGLPRPPLATRIEASGEEIILGGRPLQKPSIELHGDRTSWAIDRLGLRAPGGTVVSLDGAQSLGTALDVDSSDPDVLIAWLRGRRDAAPHGQKPLHLHGHVAVNDDGVVIDGLKADIDGGAVQGRLAMSVPSAGGAFRLDAALRADRLDLDAAAAFARSLAGPASDWPDQAVVSLDVARAIASGQELHPFEIKVNYSPKTIALEQLKLGQGNGVTMEGSGSFDRSGEAGTLSLRAQAASLSQMSALLSPLAPDLSQHLTAMGARAGPARLKLALDLGKSAEQGNRADARAVLDLNAPQLQATATVTAKPQLDAIRNLDLDALSHGDLAIATRLSADRSDALLALLGLDHAVAGGDGAAQLEAAVTGRWHTPLEMLAKIKGNGIDAEAHGTVEPIDRAASIDLRVRKANLAPLFGLKPSDNAAQNINLSSHVSLAGNKLTFDDLESTNAGSRLRGHLAVTLGDAKDVEGEVGLEAVYLAPALAFVIGTTGREASEPLSAGLLNGWHGRIGFQALRGELPGGIELRPLSGTLRSDGQSVTFDNLKGTVGGGDASATIEARDGAGGLALNARIGLSHVDGAALHYRNLKMPAGRASLQMALASQGRSVSALTGALSGNGTVTLEGASIMGLDPRAFDAAIRASDKGLPTDEAKLRQIVDPVLASGALPVDSAQIPFTIRDGRLRVTATTLESDAVRAIISGGYDVPADQTDIRVTLASSTTGSGNSHPEIQLLLAGTPTKLARNLDVTSLSSWLAVRVIDRETRRLDLLERSQGIAPELLPPPSAVARPAPAPPAPPQAVPPDQPSGEAPPLAGTELRRSQATPETSAPGGSNQEAAPLPPPIEVGPSPGAPKPRRPPPVVGPSANP